MGNPPPEKGVIYTRKKVYRHPLSSTCKEKQLLEDLNNGMEWVFIFYRISLKQAKYSLPPRNDVVVLDVRNN